MSDRLAGEEAERSTGFIASWLGLRSTGCPSLGETAALADAYERRCGIVGECPCVADLSVDLRRVVRNVRHP